MIRTGVILRRGPSTANTAFRFRKVTGLCRNVSSDARRPDSERSLTEVKCDLSCCCCGPGCGCGGAEGQKSHRTTHKNPLIGTLVGVPRACSSPESFSLLSTTPLHPNATLDYH